MSMIELMQEELLLVSGGRNQANNNGQNGDGSRNVTEDTPEDHGDAQTSQEQGDGQN